MGVTLILPHEIFSLAHHLKNDCGWRIWHHPKLGALTLYSLECKHPHNYYFHVKTTKGGVTLKVVVTDVTIIMALCLDLEIVTTMDFRF